MNNKQEYILCAAVHYNDLGMYARQPKNIETGYVICGCRHDNCILLNAILSGNKIKMESVQGFLTSKDRFVTRAEAAKIAFEARQVNYLSDGLVSEELY